MMDDSDKSANQSSSVILSLAAWAARTLPGWAKHSIYRVRPLARLVRGGLNRAAPVGLSVVSIAAGELKGMQLLLDMQTEKDYWLGTYEVELQAALRELVKPGMTAYDVGANIGYISLILARLVGASGRVYAFEALPENVERLRENLRLNGVFDETLTPTSSLRSATSSTQERKMGGKVAVISAAVTDRAGPVNFLVGPSGGMGKAEGSAGRQDVVYQDTLTVAGISLDEFVFQQGYPAPQVIKIDIEGGEVLALPGMQRLLMEYHPLALLELHGPESALAVWTTFQSAGYRICQMAPGFPVVVSVDDLNWKAYLVAIPRE